MPVVVKWAPSMPDVCTLSEFKSLWSLWKLSSSRKREVELSTQCSQQNLRSKLAKSTANSPNHACSQFCRTRTREKKEKLGKCGLQVLATCLGLGRPEWQGCLGAILRFLAPLTVPPGKAARASGTGKGQQIEPPSIHARPGRSLCPTVHISTVHISSSQASRVLHAGIQTAWCKVWGFRYTTVKEGWEPWWWGREAVTCSKSRQT
jgi:hypothetical protein